LAVGICAAVLVIGGCGGGGDSESASATSASTATATSATPQASAGAPRPSHQGTPAQGEGKQADGSTAKNKNKAASFPSSTAKAVKAPPISSAPVAGEKAPAPGVKTVKGADDSVQTYGVESTSSARTEAAIALAAYLDERRREDWASACEALAQRPKEQLEKLAKSFSAQGKETSGCAGAMAALGQGTSGSQPRGTTITEVLSLRGGGDISGDPSYLIFTGPPANTLYSMPMYLQGGGWKVGLAVPAELPL
jgi:hypothetical protein